MTSQSLTRLGRFATNVMPIATSTAAVVELLRQQAGPAMGAGAPRRR